MSQAKANGELTTLMDEGGAALAMDLIRRPASGASVHMHGERQNSAVCGVVRDV